MTGFKNTTLEVGKQNGSNAENETEDPEQYSSSTLCQVCKFCTALSFDDPRYLVCNMRLRIPVQQGHTQDFVNMK